MDTTVSIAMATYNGASYLQKQLESFVTQTRLPDELVVCDDGSTDSTVEILRDFARSAPFKVNIRVNERNIGSTRNFDQAIGHCRGSIIFLSDQDDIWYPRKIEKLLQVFRDADIGMVFSDADVIDAEDSRLGYRLWSAVGFTQSLQQRWMSDQAIDVLLRRRIVTGATLAFRADLRKVVRPICPVWVHDAWIALLVTAFYRSIFVSELLMEYRQHGRNQIGARQSTVLDRVKRFNALVKNREHVSNVERRMEGYRVIGQRMKELRVAADVRYRLQDALEHQRKRSEAINGKGLRRLSGVLSELTTGRYRRYSQGNVEALLDFIGR